MEEIIIIIILAIVCLIVLLSLGKTILLKNIQYFEIKIGLSGLKIKASFYKKK